MEIGPIFRALLHNKTRFWLIVVEIALTLAVVVNCVNMIKDQRDKIVRPTGMDEEHILIATSNPFAPEFEDDDFVEASYEDDLAAIRALPGVRAASAMHQIPLSGSGSSTGRKAEGSEEDTFGAPYYVVGTGILETLGVELVGGRDFLAEDWPEEEEGEEEAERAAPTPDNPDGRNVIITQAMADRAFPDGDALGKRIQNREGSDVDTIVGIMGHMHGSWPLSPVADRVMLYPGMPAGNRRARYVVRAEPGMVDELYVELEKELLRLNEGRLVNVGTLLEIKGDFYRDLQAINKLLAGVSILLLAVTSLGIIGLTSFSVTQRTRQIGTRRALGATRLNILRYFLVENWVVTGLGLALGVVLTYSLNFTLAHLADTPKITWPLVTSVMILLWGVGLLAALAPALRGVSVSPVAATKSV